MLETILFALFISKLKGYKIMLLFREWTIYPIFVFELIYIFLQINIFMNNYIFIKYTAILKILYLSSYLIIIIKYSRYISAFFGSICIFIGSILNNIAINSNHGKMPVFPSFSYLTGYVKQGRFVQADNLHVLGDSHTKLKFLTDIFDTGYCIMSIGDIFIRLYVFIIILSIIKKLNKEIYNII